MPSHTYRNPEKEMSCPCVTQEKVRLGGQEVTVPETSDSWSLNPLTVSCSPIPSSGQGASFSALVVFLHCHSIVGPLRVALTTALGFSLWSGLVTLSWRSREARCSVRPNRVCESRTRAREVPAARTLP